METVQFLKPKGQMQFNVILPYQEQGASVIAVGVVAQCWVAFQPCVVSQRCDALQGCVVSPALLHPYLHCTHSAPPVAHSSVLEQRSAAYSSQAWSGCLGLPSGLFSSWSSIFEFRLIVHQSCASFVRVGFAFELNDEQTSNCQQQFVGPCSFSQLRPQASLPQMSELASLLQHLFLQMKSLRPLHRLSAQLSGVLSSLQSTSTAISSSGVPEYSSHVV